MTTSITRRFRHRIPVRLRHHWKLVAVTFTFIAVCGTVFGSGMIRPYAVSAQTDSAELVTQNIVGMKDLFDTSVSHDVTLTFQDENYEDMLNEYFKTGEKNYVEADLTIDGVTIPSVGIRLKGNSTLQSLTWKGESRASDRGGMRESQLPEGFQPPEGVQVPQGGQAPKGGQPPADGQTEGDGQQPKLRIVGGGGVELKAEEPESLPWLISFDEFVEGRRYQGHSQIAVRPASGQSSTVLNEALGISVVGAASEPTQEFAYSAFAVNGRTSAPRLLVEYLDEGYAEELGNGVLYKSLASGSFTYKGEDQTEYGNDFKQVNEIGSLDLQPVIELMKWVEQSSDEEFAAGLADRLGIESFASYLALQNLMANFDDMSGPGKNYYLWYDLDTKKFTVITWDLNLAFGGDATGGVNDTMNMGMGPRQQGQPAEGQQGVTPPEGADENRPPGGSMMGGHALKEKFLATPAFKKIYEEQYRELYQQILGDGTGSSLLDEIVASYKLNKGADAAKVEGEANTLRTFLKTRTESLRTDEAIVGGS